MKDVISLLCILITACGLGLFLGGIAKTVDGIGAAYYWKSVWAGYGLFIVISAIRFRKGYIPRGSAIYVTLIGLVMGPLALPNFIQIMFSPDDWVGSKELAWLITAAAFVTIVSCSFTGTKEPAIQHSNEIKRR